MNDVLALTVMLLRAFEGCRLTAYQDVVGVWTIGYGETLGIGPGMVWTAEQAQVQLQRRAGQFLLHVKAMCPALTGARLAAAASLAYNIGLRAFYASTVRQAARRGEWQAAADAFLRWNKAGGRTMAGLVRRRRRERTIFLMGPTSPATVE